MAALAVLSLGATVAVSERALSDASDVVIRGEGDLLLANLVSDLADDAEPVSSNALERALNAHRAEGLRYVAIVDREGHPFAEAGEAKLTNAPAKLGVTTIEGRRARVGGLLFPPRRMPGFAPHVGPRPPGASLLVAELEPPMIETLRRDLAQIAVVAAVASAVLLTFAIGWSRSARRLAELEARAAREQRLVALGGMSSVMAHELRNPLASLKGHAQLLVEDLEDAPNEKSRKKAERVVREAERLELLTTSLLDFVRDGPLERRTMKARELVDLALTDLAADRVDVAINPAVGSVSVDPNRLARALHNLVDNALQAAADRTVELRVTPSGSGVRFVVRDHGPGIEPGTETQIFEPFVTTRTRGTGLGLAVARRVAEQHDGTLTAENHPSGGAVFTLTVRT
ncbi:Two-component sensor PilS [Labilithrix luteola]|uniref:histidine kinase n=2 Tax=Labilithrix luteola TaxID=1391654 RepID=A0A0K1Q2E3_9BACT|nr:Two-component sensor PilS [Labilithrix luteola]